MKKIEKNIICEQFKSLGTSDGNGGIEYLDDDSYYIKHLSKIDSFLLTKISIKELIKLDSDLNSYILDEELREYIDEYGESVTHNNDYIYELENIIDGLNIPPIIGFFKDKAIIYDGYNRILQHHLNGTNEIEVYIDENVFELYFKEKENELDF